MIKYKLLRIRKEETQVIVAEDTKTIASEVFGQHYSTTDLAVCIIRGKLGKDYENWVKNAAGLGYTEQEVRAAQDLVNVIVVKANEQKATAEQELTVITAAYDVIAGKYGDGDVRKKSLLEKYGEGLLKKIQDKVDGLLK